VVYVDGFDIGEAQLIYKPGGGGGSNTTQTSGGTGKIGFAGILEFDDLRIGVTNFKVTFGQAVDFDGTIIWNGAPVASIAAVDSFFRQESELEPQAEIHIRPDRRAKYDVVANVMASAQRHKMVKIGFVNISQFRE
jgi:hypothetical protein